MKYIKLLYILQFYISIKFQIYNVVPIQSIIPIINEHEYELQQLGDNVTILLTKQYTKLDV